MDCSMRATLSSTISWSLLKLMSIKSVMPSNHLLLCRPCLLRPSILPNKSVLRIRWPKCWSFSFSISPSNEHSELISFGIDWFHLLVVQFSSVVQSCPTLCDPMNHSMPGLLVHRQLPEFTQTHVHRVSDAIQPSHSLLPHLLLPSIFPQIRVFSNESALHIRWPKY